MRTRRLWAEFLGFFVLAPVGVAVLLPPDWMFPVLFAVTAVGLWLLWRTPGVRLRDLMRGWASIDWRLVTGFALVTAVISYGVIQATRPGAMFGLFLHRRDLWLAIMVLYPLLSALPQELIFRPLFFERYGGLMPSVPVAVLINAGVFSLAHLMYWSWVVAGMTFAGGLVFAFTYARGRNFPQVVVLHAIAGNLIFTFGLGIYFYSGNVVRPF